MNKKYILGSLVAALLLGSAVAASAAEQKMTREEYKAKLAEFTAREAKALSEIEHCNQQIASKRHWRGGLSPFSYGGLLAWALAQRDEPPRRKAARRP